MDIDGNTYPTIIIGSQEWMAANLKTTRYRDGSIIPNVTDNTAWTQLTSGAWCNYNNNPTFDPIYGKLYNWYAAATPNLCPLGWHVPTDTEWQQLESTLGMSAGQLGDEEGPRGGEQNVGGRMRSFTLWNAPNTDATNESGFSGLPGGRRHMVDGYFDDIGYIGSWWSASPIANVACFRYLIYNDRGIGRDFILKGVGFCVRCVRD
jgi:uncharacterized protein (TIGR02145 family)